MDHWSQAMTFLPAFSSPRSAIGLPAPGFPEISTEKGGRASKAQPDAAGHELAILEIRFQQRRIPVFQL